MKLNAVSHSIWLILGFSGQILFFCRFFFQWIASEKKRQSVIPMSFWYFSIFGGILLLAYAIYRRDTVFILGQAGGIFIYARNLYFINRKKT
ncbi:MAG: lipid-A-disaccharide synthase N-terminal domain-containing protein [Candidatus Omnitrophota bacterium]|nr:lipid-A-disaccharide synthase N-terminal domain-containing protein [Candidatus Omnitrophota bacterium]